MIVTLINGKFNIDGSILRFKNSFFALEFVDMLAEYFLQKGIRTSFFSCTLRSVKDHMLEIKKEFTGKSLV